MWDNKKKVCSILHSIPALYGYFYVESAEYCKNYIIEKLRYTCTFFVIARSWVLDIPKDLNLTQGLKTWNIIISESCFSLALKVVQVRGLEALFPICPCESDKTDQTLFMV